MVNNRGFEISVLQHGEVAEFTLVGQLVEENVPLFQEELVKAALWKPKRLVFHLRDLEFLCSRGFRALLLIKQQYMGAGVAVYLIAAQEGVKKHIEDLRLEKSYIIQETDAPMD